MTNCRIANMNVIRDDNRQYTHDTVLYYVSKAQYKRISYYERNYLLLVYKSRFYRNEHTITVLRPWRQSKHTTYHSNTSLVFSTCFSRMRRKMIRKRCNTPGNKKMRISVSLKRLHKKLHFSSESMRLSLR